MKYKAIWTWGYGGVCVAALLVACGSDGTSEGTGAGGGAKSASGGADQTGGAATSGGAGDTNAAGNGGANPASTGGGKQMENGGASPNNAGGTTQTGGSTSSGGSGGAGGGGGGTTAQAGAAGAGGASTCSPYADDAPMVTPTMESSAPPVMTGGTIVDGKYWLSAVRHYGGSSSPPLAERIDISGGGTYFDDVAKENGSELRNGTSMTASGSTVNFKIVCGRFQGTTGMAQFTATPTEFRMLLSPSQELKVFSKQ
jgi:hypothetical protein